MRERATIPVAIRVTPRAIQKLHELQSELQKTHPTQPVNMSDVLRYCLDEQWQIMCGLLKDEEAARQAVEEFQKTVLTPKPKPKKRPPRPKKTPKEKSLDNGHVPRKKVK